ncbi:MAG: tetratricopeptide repeat protein [Terracidiphilus sp.]
MRNKPTTESTASPFLPAMHVYAMAGLCLVVGLAIGYLFRVPQSHVPATQNTAGAGAQSAPRAGAAGSQMPSQRDMKRMADKQAEPLLEKLKNDPNNSALLLQVGAIYHTTRQFSEAAAFYGKAVQVDPKNVATRTKLAASLYRQGDVDGAIAQLNQALTYDPKDVNSLFDLGLIRLQAKRDDKGALAAWQQLLKTNPQLSPDRKATVQKLMTSVEASMIDQHGIEGGRSNGGHKANPN